MDLPVHALRLQAFEGLAGTCFGLFLNNFRPGAAFSV